MKIGVSAPENVSARASDQFVARSDTDEAVAMINAIVDKLGPEDLCFHQRAAHHIAQKLDW